MIEAPRLRITAARSMRELLIYLLRTRRARLAAYAV